MFATFLTSNDTSIRDAILKGVVFFIAILQRETIFYVISNYMTKMLDMKQI